MDLLGWESSTICDLRAELMKKLKPNIYFIVLDTHRVDRLGCYGYGKNTTPNLDAFAENSTLFEKAISPAQWTIPSHASMFSGEYPLIHNTIQASDALSTHYKTLVEYLQSDGYQTTGLCNNPLVGVLNNGFRRGFDQFYNYGGTIPSTPTNNASNHSTLFSKIQGQYFKIIDRIATPIQQAVAASPEVLQIALSPWLVPLWTRFSNFKGNTGASIQDADHFINRAGDQPQFLFLNLMGTHLPYTPPRRFIQKFAPIVLDEPDAQEFMSVYNTQALQWLLPLETPYPWLETKTLRDMYDAEVAHQDCLLQQLLTTLDQPHIRDNSIVVIVGDHGEMLGEHQIMGHGLGVHEELVHVPLIVRFPGQTEGLRVKQAVSTIRVFHTILDTAGIGKIETTPGEVVDTTKASLENHQSMPSYVFSESYPPNNLIIIMEKYAPELINRFHCRATRWAVYNQPYKLIHTENLRDDIYNFILDPHETNPLELDGNPHLKLKAELDGFLWTATNKSLVNGRGATTNLTDENVLQRLRNLGYIE